MKTALFYLFCPFMLPIALSFLGAPTPNRHRITHNDMVVDWYYQGELIFFEMRAPTTGWVAIGFHDLAELKDAYLLMGRVKDGQAQLVEHYTLRPGYYKPINEWDEKVQADHISGEEKGGSTSIRFSLPLKANSPYQKDLFRGLKYHMTMAYSREDDFQHHSMMRTTVDMELFE